MFRSEAESRAFIGPDFVPLAVVAIGVVAALIGVLLYRLRPRQAAIVVLCHAAVAAGWVLLTGPRHPAGGGTSPPPAPAHSPLRPNVGRTP